MTKQPVAQKSTSYYVGTVLESLGCKMSGVPPPPTSESADHAGVTRSKSKQANLVSPDQSSQQPVLDSPSPAVSRSDARGHASVPSPLPPPHLRGPLAAASSLTRLSSSTPSVMLLITCPLSSCLTCCLLSRLSRRWPIRPLRSPRLTPMPRSPKTWACTTPLSRVWTHTPGRCRPRPWQTHRLIYCCLLYTSPSPRD